MDTAFTLHRWLQPLPMDTAFTDGYSRHQWIQPSPMDTAVTNGYSRHQWIQPSVMGTRMKKTEDSKTQIQGYEDF
jgi:hypothetical protein